MGHKKHKYLGTNLYVLLGPTTFSFGKQLGLVFGDLFPLLR